LRNISVAALAAPGHVKKAAETLTPEIASTERKPLSALLMPNFEV
jgi:hypothetical protein